MGDLHELRPVYQVSNVNITEVQVECGCCAAWIDVEPDAHDIDVPDAFGECEECESVYDATNVRLDAWIATPNSEARTQARPLDWQAKGSHLVSATALGLRYAVMGSELHLTASIQGTTLYAGDSMDDAKAACEDHWQAEFALWVRS